MKLLDFDDVEQDIQRFEGVHVELPPVLQNIRWIKPYSQIYARKLDSNKSVKDLRVRVNEFVNLHWNMIQECDIYPSDEHAIYVYEMISDGPHFHETKLRLIATCETPNDLNALLKNDSVTGNMNRCCAITSIDGKSHILRRPEH